MKILIVEAESEPAQVEMLKYNLEAKFSGVPVQVLSWQTKLSEPVESNDLIVISCGSVGDVTTRVAPVHNAAFVLILTTSPGVEIPEDVERVGILVKPYSVADVMESLRQRRVVLASAEEKERVA